jgi:hypothetical protein
MKQISFILLVTLAGCQAAYRIDNPSLLQRQPLSIIDEKPEVADQYACSTESEPNGVMICHIPPGNPSQRHTICIGRPALPAHMAHTAGTGESDYFGECEPTSLTTF